MIMIFNYWGGIKRQPFRAFVPYGFPGGDLPEAGEPLPARKETGINWI